jgi:hypothetical protein
MKLKQRGQKREWFQLTIPRVLRRPKKSTGFCGQEHSAFFSTLVPEIRLLIYRHLYPEKLIHIRRRHLHDGGLGHKVCRAESTWSPLVWEEDDNRAHYSCWGQQHKKCCFISHSAFLSQKSIRKSRKMDNQMSVYLSLMLTCHRM